MDMVDGENYTEPHTIQTDQMETGTSVIPQQTDPPSTDNPNIRSLGKVGYKKHQMKNCEEEEVGKKPNP